MWNSQDEKRSWADQMNAAPFWSVQPETQSTGTGAFDGPFWSANAPARGAPGFHGPSWTAKAPAIAAPAAGQNTWAPKLTPVGLPALQGAAASRVQWVACFKARLLNSPYPHYFLCMRMETRSGDVGPFVRFDRFNDKDRTYTALDYESVLRGLKWADLSYAMVRVVHLDMPPDYTVGSLMKAAEPFFAQPFDTQHHCHWLCKGVCTSVARQTGAHCPADAWDFDPTRF